MADIVLLFIVVAIIITRLYSIFGTNSEEKNVKIVVKKIDKNTEKEIMENIKSMLNSNDKSNDIVDINAMTDLDKQLLSIPNFNKDLFIKSAKKVFEIILKSFSEGDLLKVRELVNKKIYDGFNLVLEDRKRDNITSEVDFICFDKSEIKDVKILKNSARVVVEFESEQVNLLKDENGKVIEGDENFVQKITDIWTFERNLNAKNSNWLLVSTKKTI